MTNIEQIPLLEELAYKSLIDNNLFKMNARVMHPIVREKIMRQFLQAVMDDQTDLVKQLLDKHPELLVIKPIAYGKKEFVIESPYTWQRFDVTDEDALSIAVKRKQIKMIELLLSYYGKLEQTQVVMETKAGALAKWSFYEMQHNEIVIPREYAAYIESLINVFANENFPNGTATDSQLSDQTEEALNLFRKITSPKKAIKLDDALDPELFLYAFCNLYTKHFNRFQNWYQQDHFCVKVGGWIQSLLSPETAKIFCEGLKYVVNENRTISDRAASLKLIERESYFRFQLKSFYRSSRDSLSDLGGKYLCDVDEFDRNMEYIYIPLVMGLYLQRLYQAKSASFLNFTQQTSLQQNQLPAYYKQPSCVIL